MYVVQTRIPVDPERKDAAVAAAKSIVQASREEPGTMDYHAAMAVGDTPILHFVERYEDAAALEAHTETEHYATFIESLEEYVAGEMETTQFEVAEAWTSTFGVDEL